MTAPANYKKQSDDVIGFWMGDGPIHGKPLSARLFDSGIDSHRPSILIAFELLEPCKVSRKEDGTTDTFEAPKGAIVGVWGKPGMKAVARLAGQPVYMVQAGTKDIGKGNPMKLYEVSSPGKPGAMIPIVSDTRKDSAGVQTFLDAPQAGKPDATDTGPVPF